MNKKLHFTNETKILEKLKLQVQESEHHFKGSKDILRRIVSYLKGDQLPDEVRAIIAEREQPEMWENIFKQMKTKIAGLKIATKQEIQAFGRQRGMDKVQANIFTQILRTTQDSTEWWANKKRADGDLRNVGISIIESIVKDTGEVDLLGKKVREIRHLHIPFLQAHIDPFAINPDYSDMRYFHRERMLDIEGLYRHFDKKKVDKLQEYTQENTNEYSTATNTTSSYSKRAKVYYSWWREYSFKEKRDIIYYCVWGDGVILEYARSPYKMNRIPISIRRMDEIDYENPADVRGLFYDLLPIQDRINNLHLRAIHMMGTNKLLFESDAVDDAEDFIEEYNKDSAAVEVKAGALKEKKILDIKQYNEIVNMRAEIADLRVQAEKIIGLNNEIMGSAVNRLSGAAIESRQNAGLVGVQEYMDSSSEQDKDLAEMDIELIQQYFKAEQTYLIVEKDEADPYFVANEIVRDKNGAVVFENGQVKRTNSLQVGRYDIVLKVMPYSRGSTAERQKVWGEFIKALANTHPEIIPEMMELSLEDTDSPIAHKVKDLVERYKQNSSSQATAQAEAHKLELQKQQLQFEKVQLEMAKMAEEIKKLKSEAELNEAKAQSEREKVKEDAA
jgi:hypothetical protein